MSNALTPARAAPLLFIIVLAACSPAFNPIQEPLASASPSDGPGSSDEISPLLSTPSLAPTPSSRTGFHCGYPEVSPPGSSQDRPLDPGLYVAYFVDQPDSRYLAIKSTHGATLRLLPVPREAGLPQPNAEAGVSPDGRYFVYYTGGPVWLQPDTFDQYDLTLHIANTDSGEIVSSIPLLRPSLLSDIDQAAMELAQHPRPGQVGESHQEFASNLLDALLAGITSVAWSPDGRLLAFAGAMEGPSSDVYTYDAANGEVRRLTSGPEEIVKIAWSPDGQWIIHGSATWVGIGSSLTNHAVRADGSAIVTFPPGGRFDRGWLTDRRFLVAEGANGIGAYDLTILDLETGRSTSIWPHPFGDIAFDTTGSTLLLGNFGEIDGEPPPGLYMLDLGTGVSTMIADFPLFDVAYWPTSAYQFVAAMDEGGLFGVTSEGDLVRLGDEQWTILPAPDHSSLALRGSRMQDLFVLEQPEGSPRLLHEGFIGTIQWSPDSSWILFSHGRLTEHETFYTIPASGGDARLIQQMPGQMCFFPEPVWVVVP